MSEASTDMDTSHRNYNFCDFEKSILFVRNFGILAVNKIISRTDVC